MKMDKITPMLPVAQLARAVDFYTNVLGFEVEHRNDGWRWAMLKFGDCRLMLDESINSHSGAPRDQVLYFYLDDIAAYHAQVRQSGGDIPDLSVTFYGLTEFRLEDPDGNQLWIGQSPPVKNE
ncbi:MAG: Glyoxalase-like domain protein [Verrucomicrobiales bacterium]|nr:Glyoxalase-like domain protein [Verrucomicrobiales bacterium]